MGNQKEKMKSYLATALTVLFTLDMGSCGHYYSRSGPSKRVFSSLVSDSRFSTLVAAVTAAGLTEEAINDLRQDPQRHPGRPAGGRPRPDGDPAETRRPQEHREALQGRDELRQCRRQQGDG